MDEDLDETDPRNALVSCLARDLDDKLTLVDDEADYSSSSDDDSDSDGSPDCSMTKDLDARDEIRLTLERSIRENHTFENSALELNTLKMAMNVRFHDIRSVLFPVLFKTMLETSGCAESPLAAARTVFTAWCGLVKKFVHNTEDQRDCLDIMEERCTGDDVLESIFLVIVRILYEEDLLEEDVIRDWHHQTRGSQIGKIVQPLIDWFDTAEVESSEESDEE